MKLTTEQLRQNAAAMLALSEGKPIEYRSAGGNEGWLNYFPDRMRVPDWECWEYRPKPEPVSRPWSKPDDVPGPVCWLRLKGDTCCWLITRIADCVIYFAGQERAFSDLKNHEYSTDRKTWHKCTVEEQP